MFRETNRLSYDQSFHFKYFKFKLYFPKMEENAVQNGYVFLITWKPRTG